MDSVDALLESACLDPSARNAILSGMSGLKEQGYGVPIPMPNLVVAKDGEADASSGSGGPGQGPGGGGGAGTGEGGTGTGTGAPGSAGAAGSGPGGGGSGFGPGGPGSGMGGPGNGGGPGGGPGFGGGGEPGMGYGSGGQGLGVGYGTASGSGGGEGSGTGSGGGKGGSVMFGASMSKSANPGYYTFMELMENSVQRSLLEESGNPAKSYTSLARIPQSMGVDKILASFPAERQKELASASPAQVAAEYVEDTAPAGRQAIEVRRRRPEARGRRRGPARIGSHTAGDTNRRSPVAETRQVHTGFCGPAAHAGKDPVELRWTALDLKTKHTQLLAIKHYNQAQFRRLLEFVKSVRTRQVERAGALVNHYFEFLDAEKPEILTEDFSRAPELIRCVPVGQIDFVPKQSNGSAAR